VITLTLLEPITAAALGAIVVHEHIRPIGWVGVGLVLAGLVVTATGASDPPEATTTVAA
jgi:DME family drug/metabolite transporter